jgi:hypothetical protein
LRRPLLQSPKSRNLFRGRNHRGSGSRSKRGAVGRSARNANAQIASGRRAENSENGRRSAGNVQIKVPAKLNRFGTIRSKAAMKDGRPANAQIKIASKPDPAGKGRSRTEDLPDLDEKVADGEVDEVAADVAINGTIKARAIVAVHVVAVANRIANAGQLVNENGSATIARILTCARYLPSQHPLRNRSRSRPRLVCGTRFLAHPLSKRRRLLMNQLTSPVHHRTYEMNRARLAVGFRMRTPKIRHRVSTSWTKRIVRMNRKELWMKTLARMIDRAADRVDEAGAAAER